MDLFLAFIVCHKQQGVRCRNEKAALPKDLASTDQPRCDPFSSFRLSALQVLLVAFRGGVVTVWLQVVVVKPTSQAGIAKPSVLGPRKSCRALSELLLEQRLCVHVAEVRPLESSD